MDDKEPARSGSEKLMKYGMWACCTVMILPVFAYFAVGGASGTTESLVAFAPLVLCVGAHLAMHRFMGKSCHGKARNTENDAPETRAVARVTVE